MSGRFDRASVIIRAHDQGRGLSGSGNARGAATLSRLEYRDGEGIGPHLAARPVFSTYA
jgi:hypothetical protein